MRTTTLFNLQCNNVTRCKLQQFVARITSPLFIVVGVFWCFLVLVFFGVFAVHLSYVLNIFAKLQYH